MFSSRNMKNLSFNHFKFVNDGMWKNRLRGPQNFHFNPKFFTIFQFLLTIWFELRWYFDFLLESECIGIGL